jgi:phosphatidylserine/phosphatidylglycerophosphate/cardiolipin synthase-like enzyme
LALVIVLGSVAAIVLLMTRCASGRGSSAQAAMPTPPGSLTSQASFQDSALAGTGAGPSSPLPPILIEALYYDGYASQDRDEAFRLINVSSQTVDLSDWTVQDEASGAGARFPPGTTLEPGQTLWCTRQADAFRAQFGFPADFETGDKVDSVPEMLGSWPAFNNDGDQCLLTDAEGNTIDALVYLGGDASIPSWNGAPVVPWSPNSLFGAVGQILYRKRDQATGLPLSDTDTAADWAQDAADHVYGRKVLRPGWDLDRFFWTTRVTETAVLTVAVGPDHLLHTVRSLLEGAQESIRIEGYTFESTILAQVLLERIAAGVEVTLLLEGGPAGGIAPAQRWICGQLSQAGGQVYFMHSKEVTPRYLFQHAKAILIDQRLALIGSENLNPSGMPADDKSDGTAGRRGVYLITDAPGVVSHTQALLATDIDLDHRDLITCPRVPELCTSPEPLPEPNWSSYTVAFSEPLTIEGEFTFELIQSPENSLRTAGSLLGLIAKAGPGDTILVEQLYEHTHWGSSDGTPEADPNLRLAAYLDAARRGARVRLLLNSYAFGDYQSDDNPHTASYLRAVAGQEGLDLQIRLGNPTALGIHNKMVLAHLDGQGTVHIGSINGSEVSSKLNRELALQVQSDAAYDYLVAVFDHDWQRGLRTVHLPLAFHGYRPPVLADYPLISELLYAVSKEKEWVELLNPTEEVLDLSGYRLGDAQQPDIFEGMYQFPPGARLAPHDVLVVAASALSFQQEEGRAPDYEFYATDPTVPTLAPAPDWGEGEWELRQDGDQVLLLDDQNRPVDVVVYGDAAYPGVVPHPGVTLYTHSLERSPPESDTDDCSRDFRDWPFPNPGQRP